MLKFDLITQDMAFSTGGTTLDALLSVASSEKFNRLRVCVAYASYKGVRELVNSLESELARWPSVSKQWLISIDFGRTDDSALNFLGGLANSEVRIPNGNEVIKNRLMPSVCFHPKTYIFDKNESSPTTSTSFGCYVSSSNLTLSGLRAGIEQGFVAIGTGKHAKHKKILAIRYKLSDWWDFVWPSAARLTPSFLSRYSGLREKLPKEDKSSIVKAFSNVGQPVLDLKEGLAWQNAKYFWIETYNLYENRGHGNPGNQLDLKRGTRVYFDFPADEVPVDTVLGQVALRYNGKPSRRCSVRYGNNQMDKINLPIPGSYGPSSYNNSFVRFERLSNKRFKVSLVKSKNDVCQWKKMAKDQGMLYKFTGGRTYGFYS